MDFIRISQGSPNKDKTVIYPDFKVKRSKDLMVRGQSFYAIWDEEAQLWSTDEYDVQRLVDLELAQYYQKMKDKINGSISVDYLASFGSGSWKNFKYYLKNLADNATQLDETLVFANTEVNKDTYSSKRLPYPLEEGSIDAYDEIIGTLYEPEERAKLEWAIGAIISGDSKEIQKFLVLYGEMGTGKSTILNIIGKLFEGYWIAFDARSLGSANNQFATEVFKSNPLVAIQHDGDLSKIEDNTRLNSIVSHEYMHMNEKYKASYMAKVNCFLILGSNKPVKITDAKSGIIRRLIDVQPSGRKIPVKRYHALMAQTEFELGAIAYHCLQVYRKMGRNYYSNYKPLSMIMQTDVFFNFVENHYYDFKDSDGVTLTRAYDMYKLYCDEAMLEYKLARHRFREELKSYFQKFDDVVRVDGKQVRSYYSGFKTDKFINIEAEVEEHAPALILDKDVSILDGLLADHQAQYANGTTESPIANWDSVNTKLKDINTSRLHYVRPSENHIVIDFDIKDSKGAKNLALNIEAASKWPATYSELSKGGQGIHLHYIYDGDVDQLSRIFDTDIEIKVFSGKSSLRRRVTKCNDVAIATINSGLPIKEKKVIDFNAVKNEQGLRVLIQKNLKKQYHAGTKPSMDFIHKILQDAYDEGVKYDVTDMRQQVLVFASNSSNQADYCLKLMKHIKFKSDDADELMYKEATDALVFFDIEVYPNLLVIDWKKRGGSHVTLINPKAEEIEPLLQLMLVGFNCRRYDNHILYAAYIGYNNQQLFELSQSITDNDRTVMFAQAYGLSYVDIYEYASVKMSLKKWQIQLGISHMEMDIPWDEPVPDHLIPKVVEYCRNDVDATEAVFEATEQDFMARQILADLSGLSINTTTQNHAAKILFEGDKNAKNQFVYTDLSEMFPGYKYSFGKSEYRGDDPKEGGYVYAEPGMYKDVAVLDIASMHPTSAVQLNVFGKYTKNFDDLTKARLAIKHKDYEAARGMLGGILAKYLNGDADQAKKLSYALKIVINIIYGMTSAKFENPFKDNRNVDNIVAKRGALFMIDLKYAVQEKGFTVAHIKTDSIKIPDATPEIIEFVHEFGKKYGYDFEHENTLEKMCLVNDAVLVGKIGWTPDGEGVGDWEAVGTQFKEPYVHKTLFTHEPVVFEDLQETKQVKTSMYLRDGEELQHVGKVGVFTPVVKNGHDLVRLSNDGKYHFVTGTKGHLWVQSQTIDHESYTGVVDYSYYNNLVDKAIASLASFGDVEWFIEK